MTGALINAKTKYTSQFALSYSKQKPARPNASAMRPPTGPRPNASVMKPPARPKAAGVNGAETGAEAAISGTKSEWTAVKSGLPGFDNQPEVQQAILWGAQQLKVNPNDLAVIIGYETAGSFSPAQENEEAKKKGKEGAVGFIQFTKSMGIPAINNYIATPAGRKKAKSLGVKPVRVNRAQLMSMTPMEQMKYVVLYFNVPINRLDAGDRYHQIYQEILAPGRKSDVWYDRSKSKKSYEKNQQFDQNKDGQITSFEAAKEIRDKGFDRDYFVKKPSSPTQTPQPEPASTPPTAQNTKKNNSFDDQVTQAIQEYTNKFDFTVDIKSSNNETRTLTIKTPYFINTKDNETAFQARRRNMPAKDKRAYGNPRFSLRAGKASPEQMKAFTQNLVNINPFGVPSSQITSTMVTAWLKKYGIGVDCSGFVTQTLDLISCTFHKRVNNRIGQANPSF